jgi:hypothetical protein
VFYFHFKKILKRHRLLARAISLREAAREEILELIPLSLSFGV